MEPILLMWKEAIPILSRHVVTVMCLIALILFPLPWTRVGEQPFEATQSGLEVAFPKRTPVSSFPILALFPFLLIGVVILDLTKSLGRSPRYGYSCLLMTVAAACVVLEAIVGLPIELGQNQKGRPTSFLLLEILVCFSCSGWLLGKFLERTFQKNAVPDS